MGGAIPAQQQCTGRGMAGMAQITFKGMSVPSALILKAAEAAGPGKQITIEDHTYARLLKEIGCTSWSNGFNWAGCVIRTDMPRPMHQLTRSGPYKDEKFRRMQRRHRA